MTLAAALAAAKMPKGPRCGTCRLLEMLTDEDRATLLAAFAADVPTADIGRAIRAEYPNVDVPGDSSLNRHRKGLCK